MIIAVVGSQKIHTKYNVIGFIRDLFMEKDPESFVSGGANGIDSIAESLFRSLFPYNPVHIFRPEVFEWHHPKGFKARNKRIAEACDELVCIRSCYSSTYGSGWTADYAEKNGKIVHRFLLQDDGEIVRVKKYFKQRQ